MKHTEFSPGIRLSMLDLVILIIGFISAWLIHAIDRNMSLMVVFVISHFFYFCNMTRMSRAPELIWAVCFILVCGFAVNGGVITLQTGFVMCFLLTVLLTVLECRKPSYHGVFWSTINPDLKTWFETYKSALNE